MAKPDRLPRAEVETPPRIDGYYVVTQSSIAGSSGYSAQSPAMSEAAAREYIEKWEKGRNATLREIPHARFIGLPGGALHDNVSGITHSSYDKYRFSL